VAFTIPNALSPGDTQAQIDKVDIDICVAGMLGNGIISGCGVASSGAANGSSVVTAGQIRFTDTLTTTTGPTLQHAANATGFDRFDLITAPSAGGVPVITAGTAAATPVFPNVPASSVCLAAVKIPNGHTTGSTIPASAYVDKRVFVPDALFRNSRAQHNLVQDTDSLITLIVKGKSGAPSWPLFQVDDFNDAPIFAIGNAGGATCNDNIATAYTIVGPFFFAVDIYGFMWRGKQASFAYAGPPGNAMAWGDSNHEVYQSTRLASTWNWGVVAGCTLTTTDLGAPPTLSPTGFRTALRMTIVGSATGWIGQLGGASALSGFVAGRMVSCVAWMRKSSGTARTANIRITWLTAAGAAVGSDVNGTGVSITGTTWQKLTIDGAIVPATATRCDIQILVATGVNGEIFDICGVGIMKDQKVGVYAPPFVAQATGGGPATTENIALAGDRWTRTDTPSVPGTREYVCLVGGLPSAQEWGALDATSIERIASDQTNSTITLATLTDFDFVVAANTPYKFDYEIWFTSAAATTGIRFGFLGPASPTYFAAVNETQISATTWVTFTINSFTAFTSPGSSGAVVTPALNFARISATLVNGANAGTVQLQFASEIAASAVVVKAGSIMQVT